MTLWESDVIMERARNRYIDSVLAKETEEEERYAEDCRGNHSAILEEFEELKAKHKKLFEEELWDKMKYFVEKRNLREIVISFTKCFRLVDVLLSSLAIVSDT